MERHFIDGHFIDRDDFSLTEDIFHLRNFVFFDFTLHMKSTLLIFLRT